MTRRPPLAAVVAVVLGGLASACGVQVPSSGPVVQAQQPVLQNPVSGPYRDPPPPPKHANPVGIVTGFFDAMTAVPLQTQAARQFLTKAGRDRWQPESVVVYAQTPTPHGGTTVTARLRGARWVDDRGTWRGRLPQSRTRVTFPMTTLAQGQWRISRAPNALLVPESWYQQNFRDASLYFFDPSGRILVPEPVHVPNGAQLATALVRSLLLGPVPSLDSVVRSFIPPGLTSPSVVVHPDGVADVALHGADAGSLDRKTTRLLLAQFAWTLAQVPSVDSFQLTINNERITNGSADATSPVASPDAVDPTDSLASGLVYGLRDGRLVSGQAKAPSPVNGPFGRNVEGITSFGISLDGTRVAGVTGGRLLVGGVQGAGGVSTALSGTRLLRPCWDFAGRIWDVDATAHGAHVHVITGDTSRSVRMPGVTGADVSHFIVSRDGSRFVAVIHGRDADRVVVSRIRYDAQGRVLGATRAVPLPWRAGGVDRIVDVGWLSPTTIGVLHVLTKAISEVRVISVDGSTPPGQASTTSIVGRAKGLATSPVGTDTSYAILPDSLTDLSGSSPDVPSHGLRAITYAG